MNKETIYQNDYSLLRPFDLEAAKRGAVLITERNFDVTLSAISKDEKTAFIEYQDGSARSVPAMGLRMAPLCWVEGEPVYKGDVLYSEKHGKGVIVEAKNFNGGAAIEFGSSKISIEAPYFASGLSLTPPMVKREGWVNIYKNNGAWAKEVNGVMSHAYESQESADKFARSGREPVIACIRIEWEEPA